MVVAGQPGQRNGPEVVVERVLPGGADHVHGGDVDGVIAPDDGALVAAGCADVLLAHAVAPL